MKKLIIRLLSTLLASILLFSGIPAIGKASSKTVSPKYRTGFLPSSEEVKEQYTRPYVPTRNLPTAVDLTSEFPPPGNQGEVDSCAAWAVVYALKTHQEYLERGWTKNDIKQITHQFSPMYVFNQMTDNIGQAITIPDAMHLIRDQGVCTLANFQPNVEDENSYKDEILPGHRAAAAKYRASSIQRLKDLNHIKQRIADGDGVTMGARWYPGLQNINSNSEVFESYIKPINVNKFPGGHAICLIGYDDNKGTAGAFKFINSWGTGWGIDGYGWISYDMAMDTHINIDYEFWAMDVWNKLPAMELDVVEIADPIYHKSHHHGPQRPFDDFKYAPSESGFYTFYTENTHGYDAHPHGILFSSDGATITDDNSDGGNAEFTINCYLIAGKTYYLRVQPANKDEYGWESTKRSLWVTLWEEYEEKPGDVNYDGRVNVNDILLLRDIIFGLVPSVPAADVNEDGLINIDDILAVRDIIFGISPSSGLSGLMASIRAHGLTEEELDMLTAII